MAFDTMDFKLAGRASKATQRHVLRGTPLHEAWEDIVSVSMPAIGPAVAKAARKLPIIEGLVSCSAEYASLLHRDNKGPAKNINGLWFGLAELITARTRDGEDYETTWTPYISGSVRFDPKNCDWPCDPKWFPDDRWAPNEPMRMLSVLRKQHKKRRWYIEVCLIESLHHLYVANFVRACPREILLGKAKFRGIGSGFDSGDLLNLGKVDAGGFKPLKRAL